MSIATHTRPWSAKFRKPAARRESSRPEPPRSLAPSTFARVITAVVLIGALIYFLIPIVWVIFSSTKTNADLASSNGFWFARMNLAENYYKLNEWTGGLFWRWVGN